MKTSVFLYPWDVVGDPDAPARVADLGVQQVTLASAYHSTRALTPRHPRHRVVTAEYAAVLYPPDSARWAGHEPRPYPAGDWAPGDAYGEAARALAAAGLEAHSWVILAHSSRLGAEHPATSVVNAYGDRYPWAPCIARPAVAAYLVELAAEAAVRPGARGVELESCGWYGFGHLHAHDKTAGIGLGDAARYLMSLCFCTVCREGCSRPRGVPGRTGRRRTARAGARLGHGRLGRGGAGRRREAARQGSRRRHLRLAFRSRPYAPGNGGRGRTGGGLPRLPGAAARRPGAVPRGSQRGRGTGAHPGGRGRGRPAVHRGRGGDDAEPVRGPRHRILRTGRQLQRRERHGRQPGGLAEDAARARSLGATELRLYHAGLASAADLRAVTAALSQLGGQ